jgi:MFS family permease
MIVVSVLGGVVLDSVDRRRLMGWSQLGLGLVGVGFAVVAATGTTAVWLLFLLAILNGGVWAIDSPTRQAMIPGLVGRAMVAPALALNQTINNLAKAAVPVLAGVVIAVSGLLVTYLMAASAFLIGALVTRGLASTTPTPRQETGRWASVFGGFWFVARNRVVRNGFILDLGAMVLAIPTALFPAVGIDRLGGDSGTVGLLYSALGFGALVVALLSGWIGRIRRHGLAIVVSICLWGLGVIGFGLSQSVVVAVIALTVAGGADIVSAVLRTSIVQLETPDELRGRVLALQAAGNVGGPRLGDLRAGTLASLWSIPGSVIAGGVACITVALLVAARDRGYLRYRPSTAEPQGDSPLPRGEGQPGLTIS